MHLVLTASMASTCMAYRRPRTSRKRRGRSDATQRESRVGVMPPGSLPLHRGPGRCAFSLAHPLRDENAEAAGIYLALRSLRGIRGRNGFDIRGRQEDLFRLGIKGHGFSACVGPDSAGPHTGPRISPRICSAFRLRWKRRSDGTRDRTRGVHASADRHVDNHVSAQRIHHHRHFATKHDEPVWVTGDASSLRLTVASVAGWAQVTRRCL